MQPMPMTPEQYAEFQKQYQQQMSQYLPKPKLVQEECMCKQNKCNSDSLKQEITMIFNQKLQDSYSALTQNPFVGASFEAPIKAIEDEVIIEITEEVIPKKNIYQPPQAKQQSKGKKEHYRKVNVTIDE